MYLTHGQLLPFARAGHLINDLYVIDISPATLLARVAEARAALDGPAPLIARQLHKAQVLDSNEWGLRMARQLHWLHIAASDTHTWLRVARPNKLTHLNKPFIPQTPTSIPA